MSKAQPSTLASSEVVRRFLDDSIIKGDPGAVDRYFAEDVTYIPIAARSPELTAIMPWIGVHHGIGGVREIYELLLLNLEVLEFEIELAFGVGDDAAAFGRFHYRARGTGNEVESDWAIRATVRDGLITYFHFYEDDYTLASAFRRSGSWKIENHLGRREVPEGAGRAGDVYQEDDPRALAPHELAQE